MSDDDLLIRAARWFGTVAVESLTPVSREVLRELITMLDAVDPIEVELDRSKISSRHDWIALEGPEVTIAHRNHDEAIITIVIGESEAIVSWLSVHDHIDESEGSPERPWTKVVADAVAALLRGHYEVEDHYRGRRLVKSRVFDVHDEPRRHISTNGNLLGLLPWGKRRVERTVVNFGAQH
jgi:hypothetical protein